MSDPLNLDALAAEWLQQCGLCDFGVLGPCTCSRTDPRVVMGRLIAEIRHLRATSERFTDPSVTEAMAREIASIKPAGDCGFCRYGHPCPRHAAEHLVNAMRAERLVVLTAQAADEIIRHVETSGASDGS